MNALKVNKSPSKSSESIDIDPEVRHLTNLYKVDSMLSIDSNSVSQTIMLDKGSSRNSKSPSIFRRKFSPL